MATPLRVLLVEDSEDDAQLAKHELEKGGYKLSLRRVDTPQEMLEALEQEQWDVILADYFVPGFEAPESLRIFKATGRDIPFIVVSGKMGEEEIAEVMRVGANDYVNKGALGRLVPVVKRELRERSLRDKRRQARERMQETFAGLEQMVAERTSELAEANRRLIDEVEERKAIERSLRHTQEELELAITGSHGVLWKITFDPADPTQIPEKANISAEQKALIGFSDREFPDSFSAWRSRIHPDDQAWHAEILGETIAGKRSDSDLRYRIQHKDGSWRWLHIRGAIARDDSGKPIRWIRMIWDVTEEKRAEEAARLSEHRIALAISASKGVVWDATLDPDDPVNSRFEILPTMKALIGFADTEMPSDQQSWASRVHPDDRASRDEQIRRVLVGEAPDYNAEYRVQHRDGSYRWLHVRGHVFRDEFGRAIQFTRFLWDATEQKQAEERIHASEAMANRQLAEIESIYRNSGIGLCVLDPDSRWLRINNYMADLNGFPVEAHLGKRVRDLLPSIADQAEESVRLVVTTGEAIRNIEITGETPAQPGVVRVWREHFLPLRNEQGVVVAVNVVAEEVTDQKKLEEQIRMTTERFRIALKNSATWVFTHDRDLRYTWVYNRVSDAEEHDIVGRTDAEIYSGHQGELLTEIKRAVLETGQPVYRELRLDTAIGEQRFYDMKLEPLRDAEGAVIGIIGSATNITSLVLQAQVIKESEEQHRALVEFSPDAIVMHVNGVILYANPAFANLVTTPIDQLAGRQILDYVSPEDRETIKNRIKVLMETSESTPPLHVRLRREDGRIVHVESTGSRVPFKGQPTALVIMRDISARLEAERELLGVTQRLHAHLENSPIAIIEFAGDFTIIRYEGDAERIFGWTADEILGKKMMDIPWVYAEDMARIIELSKDMLSGRSTRNVSANRNYRKDRKVIHCEWYNSALQDENGNLVSILSQVLDVTERVQAEATLKEREHFLQTVHNASLNGLYIFDLVGNRNTYINLAYTRITGYTFEEIDRMTGDEFLLLFHPDDVSHVLEHLAAVPQLADGAALDVEYRFWTADGRWIWCLSRDAVFARDESGRATQMIGTFADITQRKEAAEALQKSEKFNRQVVQNTTAIILRIDMETRITFANDRALEFFGYSAEELIGKHVIGTIVPEQETTGRDLTEMVNRIVGNPDSFRSNVNENMRKSGERVWVEWTNSGIYDRQGRLQESLSVGIDITERRRAEAVLLHSEAILKEAGQMAQLGAWDIEITNKEDLNANSLHWSDQIFRIFGYEPGSVQVSNELFFKHVHPDDRPKIAEAVAKAIETRSTYRLEHRIVRTDGTERIVLENGEVFFDEDGSPARIIGAVQDITERKGTEEALRNSERLYRGIGESIDYGVWVCAPDGRNIYASDSFLRLVGLTQQQCSEFGWGDVLHPDDAERTITAWKECVRTEGTWNIQHRYRGVDGQWHDILARGVPVRDDRGEVIYWAGINLDISDLKRAEQEIRDLASFPSENPSPVLRGTAHGQILYVNDAAGALLESLGWHSGEPMPEQIRAGVEHVIATGQRYSIELSLESGQTFSVLCTPSATPGNVNIYCFDLTDRKRAEKGLAESESLFRTLSDTIPQLCWMTDETGWIFWYNQRWYDFTGTTFEEMQGWGWQKVHHPDHIDRVSEHWRQHLAEGEPWEDTFPLRGADGEYRWFLSRALPIKDATGKIIRWFGTNTDVTEQRQAAQAMRETQKRLRIALEAAPIALWQQDLDLRYIWMYNSGGLGYESSQFIGKDDFGVLGNEQDAQRLTDLKRGVIETGQPVHEVVPLVSVEGRQMFWEHRYEPWLDDQGNIAGITGTAYDVTERTEAEMRLRESQDRLRVALKTSRVMVFTQDRDLRYTWVYNPAFGLLEENMIGKADLEIFPEETARKLFKLKRSVLVTGQPLRQVVAITAPDSTVKYWDLLIEPVRDSEGGVSSIICSAVDITERITQERALEESEARYRTLFELSPDGIFIQVDGRVQFVNKVFVSMMHADSAEQLLGASVWDLIHPRFHDIVKERLKTVGSGERTTSLEEIWVGLDGTEVEVEVTAAFFPWQGQQGVQVVLHDISVRKKAAAALAESEERYRDLVELSPDGVLIETSDGIVAFANRGFAKLVGAESPEQLVGLVRAQFVHPDYHDLMRSRMRALLVEGTETQPLTQEKFLRLDGSVVDVEVASARYTWNGLPAAQVIVRDITERLEAEQAVKQAGERLEAAVNHIPAAFAIFNTDHRVEYVNDYGLKLVGLPRGEVIGRRSVDINPPEVAEKFTPLLEAAIATGETQTAEIDATFRTGPATLLASYVPIKDRSGKVLQVIAVNYDISTRKQFEQAIHESEAKLQRAVRLAHLGNWEWDQESDMLFWSPELRRIFGLEETSGISSSLFFEFTHPDDRARVRTVFERAFVTQSPIDIEFRIVRTDGQTRYLQSIGEVTPGEGKTSRVFGTVLDITVIREATKELAESRAKLARASELAHMGHWECHLRSNELIWSDQLYDIFSLPRGEHMTIERFYDFIHPADRGDVIEAMRRTIEDDEPLDLEARILRTDAQVRYLHVTGEVTRDQSGAAVLFFGSIQDVSERVQADQSVRESEERFRSMADNAPVLIWVSDVTSRRTYVNEPWLEYRGRTREEELGNGWTEGLHPEDADFVLDVYLANFHTRKPFEIEYRLRRADGDYRWIIDRGRPRLLPDGTFLGFIGSAIDITERRQSEAKLFESEQRLRTAVNNYPANFVVYDSDRRIEFINRQGLEASGLSEDQIVGRRDEELFPAEVCGSYLPMLVEAQETGQSQSGEIHTVLPTGERWYVATYVPLYDREGHLSQILGITYDITERKEAEIQLRNAHDELEQRVFERTGELIEANKLLVREVEERTLAEKNLRQATKLLEEERANLQNKNIALREIFDHIEAEKTEMKERLAQNVEQAIMPTIQKLKDAPKTAVPKLLELLESDFRQLTSPFIDTLTNNYNKLSPREVEICRLIKNGMSTKEIAESLNLSPMTVQKHREVIRKKLGLVNLDTNLQSYLQTLQ